MYVLYTYISEIGMYEDVWTGKAVARCIPDLFIESQGQIWHKFSLLNHIKLTISK